MSYGLKDLTETINGHIRGLIDSGVAIINQEMTTALVLQDWGDIEGEHSDRFLFAANAYVKEQIRKRWADYKAGAEEPDLLGLYGNGFECLQIAYPTQENGERVIKRIDAMTDSQLEDKAIEYDKMGDTCHQHAAELRRYRRQRKEQADMEGKRK